MATPREVDMRIDEIDKMIAATKNDLGHHLIQDAKWKGEIGIMVNGLIWLNAAAIMASLSIIVALSLHVI